VHAQDLLAAAHVGRRDEDLAVEPARPQQRRIELVEQVGGGDHDHVAGRLEAVHLDQQLVERLLALAGRVALAALAADGVELVDEDDRRRVLARLGEEAADAGGAETGEHLHERGRRLGEELRPGLARDRLRQQRLARPRRAVQEDAARHVGAERGEPLRVAQEVDDLLQLGARLVGAGDLGPADRALGLRRDLLRLGPRHQLERSPHQEDERGHEHDRRPRLDPEADRRPGQRERDGNSHRGVIGTRRPPR
jgi:hypothetical protein